MAICWALLLLLSLLLGSDGALAGDRIKMRKAKAAMAKATRKAARRAEAANPTPPPPPLEEVDPGVVPGTSLRILSYPHPSLRAPNNDITSFDSPLRQLTEEMFSIMYASRGVGLAAPQLGINRRLMVFNPEGDPSRSEAEVVLCNPSITSYSQSTEIEEEGCLSFPGFTADVVRSRTIQVAYQTLRGKRQAKELNGWVARIFQHEYDHLDGVLYVDRLARDERARVRPALDELVRRYEAEPVGGPPAL
jgi:peptide deformylase